MEVTKDRLLRPELKVAGLSKRPHCPSIGRWTPFAPDDEWPRVALTSNTWACRRPRDLTVSMSSRADPSLRQSPGLILVEFQFISEYKLKFHENFHIRRCQLRALSGSIDSNRLVTKVKRELLIGSSLTFNQHC